VVQGAVSSRTPPAAERPDRDLVDLELLADLVQTDCAHDHFSKAATLPPAAGGLRESR